MTRSIIWEWGVPRTYQGYWDMGAIRIPPVPPQLVLTDRATGTQYLVTHDGNNPGVVGITTTIPQRTIDRKGTQAPATDILVYPAGEEPVVSLVVIPGVGRRTVRMTVTSGVLGYSYDNPTNPVQDQNQPTIYIRTTLAQSAVQVILPVTVGAVSPINFVVVPLP